MAKLRFEESCGYGLTLPHQVDLLCLSTRTHWVHRLTVLSWASQVIVFFSALANHSRVWMLGRQLITLLPISSRAHPTPARPTQLRIALYNVMSSLDYVAVSLTSPSFFLPCQHKLYSLLFLFCAMMFISETNTKLQFHCGLAKICRLIECSEKVHAFLIYVIHFYVVLIK